VAALNRKSAHDEQTDFSTLLNLIPAAFLGSGSFSLDSRTIGKISL
jgi:hypothetical protein